MTRVFPANDLRGLFSLYIRVNARIQNQRVPGSCCGIRGDDDDNDNKSAS